LEGLLAGEMTYNRSYKWKLNSRRKQIIASCIEMYVCGKSIVEIERITGKTHSTIARYLTVHYFQYRGDDSIVLVLESQINSQQIVNKPVKIVKKAKPHKPVYWKKAPPRPMPEQAHRDYQLKRKLSFTFNYHN
jgi:hypothetical protein